MQEEETLAIGLSKEVVEHVIKDLADDINLMVTPDDHRAKDDATMEQVFTYIYDETSMNILRKALGRLDQDYDEYHHGIHGKLLQLIGDPDEIYFTEKHMMGVTDKVLQLIGGRFRRRVMQDYESRVIAKVKLWSDYN